MPREDPVAEKPVPPRKSPEGYYWVWQNDGLFQKDTHFKLDDSGWLIDPKTKAYIDAYTGWRYDAADECLVDDATGTMYTMDRQEIEVRRGHPLLSRPGCSLRGSREPELVERRAWLRGSRRQALRLRSEQRLAHGPENRRLSCANCHGYIYDAEQGNLLDEATGRRYSMSYEPLGE